MHNIFSYLNRLLAWLNEPGSPAETRPSVLFDADLPPYHPLCD
jgi:hypothetical protein